MKIVSRISVYLMFGAGMFTLGYLLPKNASFSAGKIR